MLASPMSSVAPTAVAAIAALMDRDWLFEIKWDGVRCIVEASPGTVKLTTRSGQDVTDRFPELDGALGPGVYDGELVAYRNGSPSFPAIASRIHSSRPAAGGIVAFVAFDVLAGTSGKDLTGEPLDIRQGILEEMLRYSDDTVVQRSRATSAGSDVWSLVAEMGLEGLVAKNPASAYVHGRSREWVKIKQSLTFSAVVVGFEPMSNVPNTMGALLLARPNQDGLLVSWGKVGTGFTQAQRQSFFEFLTQHPMAHPVVDVDVLELTASGAPRHPTFRGVRADLTPEDLFPFPAPIYPSKQ